MKKLKKEIQEELEQLAPSLAKLKKEEHFEVPENYFQQLPDQILSQIDFGKNESVAPAAPVRSWVDDIVEKISFLFQPRVAIAFAALLLLLVSVFLINRNDTPGESGNLLASISEAEMEEYLEANLNEFEEESLYDLVDEVASNDFTEDLNEEDLENLMEEFIDDLDDSELEDLL